ncbi:HEAT repeat domain-containing protein [Pontibacter vulgaris]|uniref:HEAT repeat domain-containing protein n=1 Tax=Pontibacter vulgaris TaxID=2905679 RepID=UPI001FA80F79|nr:HEAT repeat domain-containing protein [Pontibacter vulgaris]
MEDTFTFILPFQGETNDRTLVNFNLLLAAVFLALAFLLFLFILISRWRDGYRVSRRLWMENISQEFITTYLFSDDDLTPEQSKFFQKKYIKNDSLRQIFLENLILLHKNLIGESSDKLRQLYIDFGLYQFSKQKLYSDSWNVIAKGIGELAEMDMQQDSKLIRSFVNHSHSILRSEALVALIKLRNNKPFAFLNKLEEPLLEWQQMQLARAAQKNQLLAIPNFSKWLKNKEDSIVIFCLRMITYYTQHDALPVILDLLIHPSAQVREEAVATLRHLEAYEVTPKLVEIYENETVEVKLEILRTLATIAGPETIELYESQLQQPDKRLQLAAARALVFCGEEGKEKILSIKNDLEHSLQTVAAYALDERL